MSAVVVVKSDPKKIRPLYPDPFQAELFESTPVEISEEQKSLIRQVLDIACSDSRFAEKAYTAINRILTGGVQEPSVVTSLVPPNATIGEPAFDLHVIGSGFNDESVIVFNGIDEPTTFVSETELVTGVNMPLWVAPVVVPVTVRTEGVLSVPVDFEFKEQVVGGVLSGNTPPIHKLPAGQTTPTKK